ncbi:hypothetical protein K432DRAFT_385988 [Lepidopterella palustris CBS 459.81]|uniref:Uncharacterized protein n=1 Tax=Lepidopterella palustris CBS 459.81 TaxID=1314670 RepID=A0A8E2E1S4_9PEZI|nr:hypothetical protein K432DRAFT_385988 [Lepidopterella palustris CBS 459.81]
MPDLPSAPPPTPTAEELATTPDNHPLPPTPPALSLTATELITTMSELDLARIQNPQKAQSSLRQ